MIEDLPAFVSYRSDPEVARFQSWETPFTMDAAERFLASQRDIRLGTPGEWLQLAAVHRLDQALAGDCAVRVSDRQRATAEIGVTFSRNYWGLGLAREALRAVITELLRERAVHRVYAETDERNHAVHRLLESLGLRCEARLIEADWFKGAWSTSRIYAVLDREWAPRSAERRSQP